MEIFQRVPISMNTTPLFVDLDGTVIKGDLLLESAVGLLARNPFNILLILWWLRRGRAYLKWRLAQRVDLPLHRIPLNREFMGYLEGERRRGRTLILISAADQTLVTAMNDHLQMFGEAIGSDGRCNLRAENKLARVQEWMAQAGLPAGGFAYAGDSRADLPLWRVAEEVIVVNAAPALLCLLRAEMEVSRCFDQPPPRRGGRLGALYDLVRGAVERRRNSCND